MANNTSRPYYARTDAQYQIWLANFASVVDNNMAALGLSTPDAAAIDSQSSEFSAAYNDMVAKRAASEAATRTKTDTRTQTEEFVKTYVKRFQNSTTIPASLKAALDIPPVGTRGIPTPPSQPTDLKAEPNVSGTVRLAWKGNNGRRKTAYVIEELRGGTWVSVAVTFAQRVQLSAYVPGVQVWFRVTAERNNQRSAPSTPAAIYGPEEGFGLEVAA